jgi:hypothetical protein
MPSPFRPLSPSEFVEEVARFPWARRVWRVDMHHTFYPAHADYSGLLTIEKMRDFHVEVRGFEDIAQHVSIAPDGVIWTGRDWNRTPASVGFGMNAGVFMFEMIGNFDKGHDLLKGAQVDSVITVIDTVQRRFGLPWQALLFHRDVPVTEKTCPGTGVAKLPILRRLRALRSARMTQACGHQGKLGAAATQRPHGPVSAPRTRNESRN